MALRAAAERAAALGSHEQAVALYDQALEVTSDTAERAELLERAFDSSYLGLDKQRDFRLAEAALAARRELGERRAIANATARVARAMVSSLGDPVARSS